MYRTLLTGALLLGGGTVAAELTCVVCTAINSFSEYREKMKGYRKINQQLHLEEALDQQKPVYKSIFWNNLKKVHAVTLGRH